MRIEIKLSIVFTKAAFIKMIFHQEIGLKCKEETIAVAYRGGCSNTPLSEITKVLQNRAKLNPIVKTVQNC